MPEERVAKFQVSVVTKIEKDGQAFFDDVIKYSNMEEDDVVLLEGMLIKLLGDLNKLGEGKAALKKDANSRK